MVVRIPLSNSGILSAHGYEDVKEKSKLDDTVRSCVSCEPGNPHSVSLGVSTYS